MNQDSFRKLLHTQQAGPSNAASTSSRGTIPAAISKKQKKASEPSQPVFKPRKVKKDNEQKYRDRAAERRTGEGNDYAEVEALLEDFEQRTANNEDKAAVEQQRRYLGGDGDHSILVKGLDMALFEQNKARVGLSTEDDDSLEQAFLDVASDSVVRKKKTREDLIRELKEKRQKGESDGVKKFVTTAEEDARLLEEAKKAGKFKPIGAPVDNKANSKRKREKDKDKAGEKRKKQRAKDADTKLEATENSTDRGTEMQADKKPNSTPPPSLTKLASQDAPRRPEILESEPINDDFDIFAGAGEYQGYDLDDEDDGHKDNPKTEQDIGPTEPSDRQPAIGRWFAIEEAEKLQTNHSPNKDAQPSQPTSSRLDRIDDEEAEEHDDRPSRLVPLESSALPDIKDFLAMDEAVEAMEKKQRRKGMRKGEKGDAQGEQKKLSAAAKVERDYKRLQSHTEKRTGA